jgi:hypothetical protein
MISVEYEKYGKEILLKDIFENTIGERERN